MRAPGTAGVAFTCLHRDVPPGGIESVPVRIRRCGKPSTGPTKVVRCEFADANLCRELLDHVPHQLFSNSFAPESTRAAHPQFRGRARSGERRFTGGGQAYRTRTFSRRQGLAGAGELCQTPIEPSWFVDHGVPLHYGVEELHEDWQTIERLGL
jgi:hypothetical protein